MEERAQGALGNLHGGGAELPDLPQFEVVGADLVLAEEGQDRTGNDRRAGGRSGRILSWVGARKSLSWTNALNFASDDK